MDANERNHQAFLVARANRKFEIELFWKRSLFYWGFIASAFVGFAAFQKSHPGYAALIASFGWVCSVAWALGNRGSKYWQEYWERKVVEYQEHVTGDIFIDHRPTNNPWHDQFAPRRISVSKLTIGLSDYTVALWSIFLLEKVIGLYYKASPFFAKTGFIVIAASSIIYGIYLYVMCRSED